MLGESAVVIIQYQSLFADVSFTLLGLFRTTIARSTVAGHVFWSSSVWSIEPMIERGWSEDGTRKSPGIPWLLGWMQCESSRAMVGHYWPLLGVGVYRATFPRFALPWCDCDLLFSILLLFLLLTIRSSWLLISSPNIELEREPHRQPEWRWI